jgi:hypothetical protein
MRSPASHLAHLAWKHVVFHPSFVTLTFPASKTDQFRVGTEIYLAANPLSPLCPVKALRLKAFFNRYRVSPHASLFRRPFQQPFTKAFFIHTMIPRHTECQHPHFWLLRSLPPKRRGCHGGSKRDLSSPYQTTRALENRHS